MSLATANDADIADLVDSICTTLSRLPQPQTFAIWWRSIGVSGNGSPPELKFPIVLRPLQLVRRTNSGITIAMPENGLISTADLAEQHKNCRCLAIDPAREHQENLLDIHGDLLMCGSV